MKNIKKISIIIIILLAIGLVFSSYSHASEIGNIFSDADDFLTKGDLPGSVINETQLQKTSNFMYKLLLSIGIIVMFIVGTILGIQFMIASAEDKAKVKEALVPYIVGCFVIFGAFTIWEITVNTGQEMFETAEAWAIGDYCLQCGRYLTGTYCNGCSKNVTDTFYAYRCQGCGVQFAGYAGEPRIPITPERCPRCNIKISKITYKVIIDGQIRDK